jgi:uncharacterized protein YbcI
MDADRELRTLARSDGHADLQPSRGAAAQSLTSAISNAVVRLYAEHVGRGPTKARTVMSRNLVTVVLEDTFTKGERALLQAGERDAVLTTRRAYQRALREPLRSAVEELTQRNVIGVLSDHNDDPDIAVENFVLEPEPFDDTRSEMRDRATGVSSDGDGTGPNHDGASANHDGASANHDGASANHDGASASHDGASGSHDGASG